MTQQLSSIELKNKKKRRGSTTQLSPRLLVIAASLGFFLTAACKKDHGSENTGNLVDEYKGLPAQTVHELKESAKATLRYKNLENALADGYMDINVVVQNMGFHYMKASLADTVFDYTKPEILVYNKNHEGKIELVAVEYAVPISLRPDAAPEGFTGTSDVWKRDTGFGLWLLHAWVWSYNPQGVFNPTNPGIHLH